jgi:DNA invertase Pin-like site-specific DNA recombinase
VLVVAVRDRLARDVEAVVAIERAVRSSGAVIVQADGTGNGADPGARFMRRIDDARAEYERALISARTKAALGAKRARGERVGEVPFGYRLASDGKTLEPSPEEQSVIAAVLDLRGQGLSYRAAAAELARRGVTSPRSGRPLAAQQVHRIVQRSEAA